MKNINYLAITFIVLSVGTQSISAQVYEVPPSSTTRGNVPWISDQAMEQCVILYNDTKNLKIKMDGMYVDRYNETSVNTYNNNVSHHTSMIQKFNRDCAGKQSESAYKAAKKLNEQQNAINK